MRCPDPAESISCFLTPGHLCHCFITSVPACEVGSENKSFLQGKMGNLRKNVLDNYKEMFRPCRRSFMFVYPRAHLQPLFDNRSRSKTTTGSGHRFITMETRRLSLSSLCCPQDNDLPYLHNYSPITNSDSVMLCE